MKCQYLVITLALKLGQLAKMQALWRNFKLEFVNMFEDEGNVFTILKMTAGGLEALSCHHAVIKNEKYA